MKPITKTPVDPLKEDFRNFLFLVWGYLNLPNPTPVQYDIARFLQTGPNKICIEAFRGVGKSWVTAAYVLWLLYCNPQLKIMVVSASKSRADNFTTFCLQLLDTIPELHFLKPRSSQRCSRIEFDVGPAQPDQSASVVSKGISGQLTGSRADVIISDDVEVPNNSLTADMRDKLSEKIKEYSAILKPLADAKIIYLGTPQTEDSIYNKLPETFTLRAWPSQVPTEEEYPGYGGCLAPIIEKMYRDKKYGDATDPQRFTNETLMERRAEYGSAGYQLQFMLNTKLSDEERYPLKLKDILVMPVPPLEAPVKPYWLPDPDRRMKDLPNYGMAGDAIYAAAGHSNEFLPYQSRVLAIDPSGRGADETGYAVGYHLAGNVWVPEAGGLQGGYDDDTLKKLVALAKKHKVHKVIIESNFGDGMFSRILEPLLIKEHQCGLEEVRHHQMKEMRIVDTLEPVISGHKLIIDPQVFQKDHESVQRYEGLHKNSKSLFYQMTHICRERGALRHDDRIDVLAILVAHFVDMMNQSDLKKVDEERERLLMEHLMEHQRACVAQSGGGRNMKWASRF